MAGYKPETEFFKWKAKTSMFRAKTMASFVTMVEGEVSPLLKSMRDREAQRAETAQGAVFQGGRGAGQHVADGGVVPHAAPAGCHACGHPGHKQFQCPTRGGARGRGLRGGGRGGRRSMGAARGSARGAATRTWGGSSGTRRSAGGAAVLQVRPTGTPAVVLPTVGWFGCGGRNGRHGRDGRKLGLSETLSLAINSLFSFGGCSVRSCFKKPNVD